MDDRREAALEGEVFRHPLIKQLGQLAAEAAGVRIMIVHPTASGWGQVFGDNRPELLPAFCKLIQSSQEGAKQCRMCHILMSVAACSGGQGLQRCHAGCCVVVCPATNGSRESVALLSTCTFVDSNVWAETCVKGKALGIDEGELRKAFFNLPKLNARQRQLLESAMKAMSLAVQTVRQQAEAETRLQSADHGRTKTPDLKRLLKKTDWAQSTADHAADSKKRRPPLLIRVVCELVHQRPELQLTVKELAVAARVTPNHFTTLFRQWTGQSFTEYLADQRMNRARRLLSDLTLNVNEIARLVGYDDPGYFARRFRQKTGLSPREWREQGPHSLGVRKR